LIDTFKEYFDNSGILFTQKIQDAIYEVLLISLTGYMNKVSVMKGKSEDLVSKFNKDDLDFIYIDGSHEYEYVKKDLEWADKVKSGGIIGGHDYDCKSLGVIQAVNEFVAKNNYRLFILEPREGDMWGVEWAIIK